MSMTFLKSVEVWRAAQPDDDPDAYENAERIILRRKPHSAAEAAIILEVVAANVSAGPRCDGLDNRAIESTRLWLLGSEIRSLSPSLKLVG